MITRLPTASAFILLLLCAFGAAPSRGGTISGAASVKETGAGLQGVTVRTFSLSGGAGWAVTDSQGDFNIGGLPSGEYIIYGKRNGYGTAFLSAIRVTAGQPVSVPNLVLTNRPGRVEGLVTFQGAPMAEVVVEALVRTDRSNAWSILNHTTTTDQSGTNYVLPDLSEGLNFDIRALATEIGGVWYAPAARQNVTTAEGGATRVDFALREAARIFGTVIADGNPVPGVVVSLPRSDFFTSALTDSDGHYELIGPPGDSQEIHFDPPDDTDLMTTSATIAAGGGDTRHDVTLQDGAVTVSGLLTDEATGLPVPSIQVFSWHDDLRLSVNATSGSDGRFTLSNVPPGGNDINVRPQHTYARDGVTLTLNADASGVDFMLIPASTISGHVRDLESQDPVPGVRVVYRDRELPIYEETTTDADGAFSFRNVREGALAIRVEPEPDQAYAGRFYADREIALAMGLGEDLASLPIMVEAGALVSGQVRDAGSNPAAGVEVYASGENGEDREWLRTDASGSYGMRLPPGRHVIGIDSDEGDAVAMPVVLDIASVAGAKTVDFTTYDATSGARLGGRLTNPDDHPVYPDTFLGLVALPDGTFPVTIDNYYLLRTASFAGMDAFGGNYEMVVPPDEGYTLAFFLQGDSIVVRGEMPISAKPAGSLTSGLDFAYTAEGGTISGRLTVGGTVMADAEAVLWTSAGDFAGFSETGPSGDFVFRNVAPGSYRLQGIHPESGTSPVFDVNDLANGETRAGITLDIPQFIVTARIDSGATSQFELGFEGTDEKGYLIQVSPDLKRWITVARLAGTDAARTWPDLHPIESAKFYRVLERDY